MSANIMGKMIYSHMTPMWHSITEPSLVPMTAEEIFLQRFGGGYSICLRPAHVELNGELAETGRFAVVRSATPYDNQERLFEFCTDIYHPLQPVEVARKFDTSVCEFAETVGVLGNGEEMFITWKMPSFDVLAKDPVDMYGCIKTGYDTRHGHKLFISTVRIVCQNTFVAAENWAKNNGGNIWHGKATNENLLEHLGYWMSHVQGNAIREANLLQSFFGKLAQTPVKNDVEAKEIISTAFPTTEDVSPFYPVQLRDAKKERIEQYNAGQKAIQVGVYDLFSGAGTAITPDFWGLFCATTEFFCHVMPSKKPIAESVMFGNRQKASMQMVEVLKERSR